MAKEIPDPGFAGDDGAADEALAAAQDAHARDPARLPEVLAALHRARVLAPVVAVPGETGTTDAGLRVDKTADIALALLDDGSGHRAVPVFSSLAALARWDPSARPVPVEGPRAAASRRDGAGSRRTTTRRWPRCSPGPWPRSRP